MLHVHRAERADALADALRGLLSDPLPDPFAKEVVAVPTRGMERWLTQRTSWGLGASPERADGVCANVDFPTPQQLVSSAVAAASGVDADQDPWLPERAVWPLLAIVGECLDEPWLRTLAEHLKGPIKHGRRFASLRHLAGLYDRYALHRPEMVRAWAAGADGGVPDDAAWQAELWRRLRDRIGSASPAERIEAACARLRSEPGVVELPERFGLFNLTRLPSGHLDVLRALAAARDVHLYVLHPSPALWARLEGELPVIRRKDDLTAAHNALLASWGRDSKELQLVLKRAEHDDHRHAVEHGNNTLLARIQAGVREDRPPTEGPADDSVQVHSCHGRARQVEVLRDTILHLLADDPTLEPRDVIVMCPDIETFAPLLQATFGAGEIDEEGETQLRVRLADRSLRQTNPILGVVARLLELADERLTASQVLDLADREPVRRRFGFDDEDVARLEEWVRSSGIRWGLDAEHRAPFKLDQLASGTWRAGLDRLLLGVTMTEDEQRLFTGVLPLDDVDSGAIDLAGRFAELVARLEGATEGLNGTRSVSGWGEAIAAAAEALTATTPRDAWQANELHRLLGDVQAEAEEQAIELGLSEVRALLADRLKGRPTRANFRTGHLTVCTLVPMRSVPHRVVCLLGLDDGVFPRKAPRDGDDLMLDDPHLGERDARSEDRQLLLDALMAATDRLIVTYTGNDERSNLVQPPAVPIGELLEVTGKEVVVRHPLQPFDPRNFIAGEVVAAKPWSFDRTTLRGAEALASERHPPAPFLDHELPGIDAEFVELDQLVRFVERPVRAFLRRRLGISVWNGDDEVEDALPVELDSLETWQVGDRLLKARLAGTESKAAYRAEIARGTLPPGVLGEPVIRSVLPTVEDIVKHVPSTSTSTGSVDVKVALRDGRTLRGTVPGVGGDTLLTVTYSRVNPRHRITAWTRLLALTAAYPGRTFEAVTIGRPPSNVDATVAIARIPPVDAHEALDHLEVLLDLYDRGMREPPPLACLTSAAYAAAARSGGDPVKAACNQWESGQFPKEDVDPEHRLVLGELGFDELLAEPARADEVGTYWDQDVSTRFGRWALRLWTGLLQSERVTHE
jgi:exodeoxyribonuclease V gamma subunit